MEITVDRAITTLFDGKIGIKVTEHRFKPVTLVHGDALRLTMTFKMETDRLTAKSVPDSVAVMPITALDEEPTL